MAILAIDTSTIVSGAAIVQKDKLVAEIIMQLKITPIRSFIRACARCFKNCTYG